MVVVPIVVNVLVVLTVVFVLLVLVDLIVDLVVITWKRGGDLVRSLEIRLPMLPCGLSSGLSKSTQHPSKVCGIFSTAQSVSVGYVWKNCITALHGISF